MVQTIVVGVVAMDGEPCRASHIGLMEVELTGSESHESAVFSSRSFLPKGLSACSWQLSLPAVPSSAYLHFPAPYALLIRPARSSHHLSSQLTTKALVVVVDVHLYHRLGEHRRRFRSSAIEFYWISSSSRKGTSVIKVSADRRC